MMKRILLILAVAVVIVSAKRRRKNKTKLPCAYQGNFYMPGDVWYPHPCARCECGNLHSECDFKTCPACDGKEGDVGVDQCCAPCDGKAVKPTETGFCFWRGKRYEDGESFTLNECTDCSCDGGIGSCIVRSCEFQECANGEPASVVVPGECCHLCPENVQPGNM